MISPEDKKLLEEAVAACDDNVDASLFDKGYATAMKIMLIMLTNRSNTQRYNIGHDSLASFKIRQIKASRRR